MAVEIKYVVVRKGEEKMTFASKKEADGKKIRAVKAA
ncbi:protein YecA [Enterobacter hormaechei]|nr:protein YecA [Enterobacter hormaechei]